MSVSGFVLWRPWRLIVSGAIVAVSVVNAWLNPEYLELVYSLVGIFFAMALLAELLIRVDAQKSAERDRIVFGERDRIARDVHDLIGHSLSVVSLKVQLAQRLIDSDPLRAKAELAEVQEITQEALSEVRRALIQERSATAAAELPHALAALRDAEVAVRVEGEPQALVGPMAMVAGWLLREATTNIVRHAAAKNCVLGFAPRKMTIADDGVGISGPEQGGLRGIRERVAAAGGRLNLGVGELGGTLVEVSW